MPNQSPQPQALGVGVTTDKSTYTAGEAARVTVEVDWGDSENRGWADPWARVTVGRVDVTGEVPSYDEYPAFPLHELDRDRPTDEGWLCVAIGRRNSGIYRIVAIAYEPERDEYGSASTEYEVPQS